MFDNSQYVCGCTVHMRIINDREKQVNKENKALLTTISDTLYKPFQIQMDLCIATTLVFRKDTNVRLLFSASKPSSLRLF